MTHNELIYRIKEVLYGASISDDSNISNRLISSWIQSQRAYWIKQDFNKKRNLDNDLVQDLGCLELESTDIAECCDTVTTDCYILRTKLELPMFVELNNRNGITRVGLVDKLNYTLNFMSYHEAMRSGNSRWTENLLFAFYRNRRIYIKHNNNNIVSDTLKYINVQGILENPLDAVSYTTCSGQPCYNDDSEYPIKAWMVDMMEDYIIKNKFNIKLIQGDQTNDSSEQERSE